MTSPQLDPEPVSRFEPVNFTVTEADSIARQDSDAAGWYRSLPYNGRP